jgi:hypothetical protein
VSEEEFFVAVAAWLDRTKGEALGPREGAAFRALCREQAAVHSSADWRSLFADAAALPVITVNIARCLAPFVEDHECRVSR